MHKRQAIRAAVVAAVTGLTTTGTRVTSGELHTRPRTQLPGLAVAVAGGAGEMVATSIADARGDMQVRELPVEIRAMVAVVSGYLDTLDTACAEVETALHAAAGVAALVLEIRLVSTVVEISGDGETPVAVAVMSWRVLYAVNELAPVAN